MHVTGTQPSDVSCHGAEIHVFEIRFDRFEIRAWRGFTIDANESFAHEQLRGDDSVLPLEVGQLRLRNCATPDPAWQFVERADWIPSIGASYFLGVDGFSALLVMLTTLMGAIAVLSSWTAITERVKEFYITLLILQTGMIGAFVSLDFLLFFLFWEVMLVPMYFIIGIWGGERRIYASLKFFIYTMVGSLLMLVAIVWIGFAARDPMMGTLSFDYDHVLQYADATAQRSRGQQLRVGALARTRGAVQRQVVDARAAAKQRCACSRLARGRCGRECS